MAIDSVTSHIFYDIVKIKISKTDYIKIDRFLLLLIKSAHIENVIIDSLKASKQFMVQKWQIGTNELT